jgi:hypothetical protein
MRSSWVLPFLRRTAVDGLIAHSSPSRNRPVSSSREKTGSQCPVQVAASPAHARLCLGIGDGTMHRQ